MISKANQCSLHLHLSWIPPFCFHTTPPGSDRFIVLSGLPFHHIPTKTQIHMGGFTECIKYAEFLYCLSKKSRLSFTRKSEHQRRKEKDLIIQ